MKVSSRTTDMGATFKLCDLKIYFELDTDGMQMNDQEILMLHDELAIISQSTTG